MQGVNAFRCQFATGVLIVHVSRSFTLVTCEQFWFNNFNVCSVGGEMLSWQPEVVNGSCIMAILLIASFI